MLYKLYGLNLLLKSASVPLIKTVNGESFGLPTTASYKVGELRTSVSINVKIN